jgi:hypothetical protein
MIAKKTSPRMSNIQTNELFRGRRRTGVGVGDEGGGFLLSFVSVIIIFFLAESEPRGLSPRLEV